MTSIAYVDTPNDPYEVPRFFMLLAHKSYQKGFESVLSHLDDPPLDDLKNFLGYCEACLLAISYHHHVEETVFFPFANQKLDFSHEMEQHKDIHAGLDRLIDTIQAAQTNHSLFDAAQMKKMMVGLRTPMYEHFDEEIAHLNPAELKVFPTEEIVAIMEKVKTTAKGTGDPFKMVPFYLSHRPLEYSKTWPPMPWFVRKFVVPYVIAARHSGYWRYSPYLPRCYYEG
ncbi:hypothetical protein K439DRAFT_1420908 [Ramaria rubella]|nr:hypothetical protein K439DRAFT_1420908 [Ramaria rubella]